MTELELAIVTELSIYSTLDGEEFWEEVARLMTFGDDWASHL